MGFGTNYLHQFPVGSFTFLNPSWQSAVNLHLEQPLFKGRGADFNRGAFRIAQSNANQSNYEFQAEINQVVMNVEIAYWDWVLTEKQQEVRIAATERAKHTVEQTREMLRLGDGILPEVQQAEEQYHLFRVEETLGRNTAKQARIALITLLGMTDREAFCGYPSDEPMAETEYDREMGEHSAMNRFELAAMQSMINAAQIEVRLKRNALPLPCAIANPGERHRAAVLNRLRKVLGLRHENLWNRLKGRLGAFQTKSKINFSLR